MFPALQACRVTHKRRWHVAGTAGRRPSWAARHTGVWGGVMGIKWLAGHNGRARAVPMLAAAALVPAMMAAASGPARAVAAEPRASGHTATAGTITTMA